MAKIIAKANVHNHTKNWWLLLLAALVLYGLVPQFKSFKSSLMTIKHADFALVGASIVCLILSYITGALVYQVISKRRLKYSRTLLVQAAGGFTNRLIPGGGGALATNADYLIKAGYSLSSASALVSLNNLLGFVGNVTLLAITLMTTHTKLSAVHGLHLTDLKILLVLLIIVATLILTFVKSLRVRLERFLKQTLGDMIQNMKSIPRVLGGFVASAATTILLVSSFYYTCLAVNLHLSIAQIFWVFVIGVIFSTLSPTPGGLGGAEAGIVLSLTSIGVSSQQALAAALSYRLVSYWLPILPGLICFQLSRRRHLL
ncbi:MAG TPA: lysylphosphatidylglycerol synthase transmembrane domain-containing protein [Candidatus Saccharimonadales bacterium]|nr:lysylphosphatidylglycerol synthase transmembrane domain-containing protein [Candidatus Saccharimonadales bacterium]